MDSTNLYLAIDQGGHASRAMVFDHQGGLICEASRALHAIQPQPDYVEYQPEALVGATRAAITECLQQLGPRAKDVCCAGLATQRSNIACWDRYTGEPLSHIISWQDLRNAAWMEQFSEQRQLIHQHSGLFANGHYGVSKLRWCIEHLPEVKQAQQQGRLAWGPMASFLAYSLLRERPIKVDPANASRTLLLNIESLQWDETLANCFSTPLEALPTVVPSCSHYGHLDLVDYQVPLQLLNGDQSSALFAHGQPDPGRLYINIGTGAFVQRLIEHPIFEAQQLLNSVVWQDSTQVSYVLEGTVNGAACALQQVAAELAISMTEVAQQSERWLSGADDVPLFMNSVSGIGSPYWRSDLHSHFIGDGEPWQMMVAVFESILFLLNDNIKEMARYTVPASSIQLSGGLANSDALCQRLADLTGLPVIRPSQCEATAKGVAFLLSESQHAWSAESVERFEPSACNSLQRRYQRWHQALQSWLLTG